MSTRTTETEIAIAADVPSVRITRGFDAPLARVFRAHVDPELFARWVGPDGSETRIDRFDCRTGGAFRFLSVFGDEEYGFFGSFHEVRPDELIVQTFTFEGAPDSVSLERLTLEPLPGDRTRLTGTSMFDSFEARDGMVASGMEAGVSDGYRKLDALLADSA